MKLTPICVEVSSCTLKNDSSTSMLVLFPPILPFIGGRTPYLSSFLSVDERIPLPLRAAATKPSEPFIT